MSKINRPYEAVSLQEVTNLIAQVGDKVTVLAQGHIGTGKSSMLKVLADKFPDYHPCYLDCTTLDVGDISVPKIKTVENGEVTSFVPNENLGFHLAKPVILMVDELGKASKSVMNALLRIMLERRLGVNALPEGSIVFATTNLGGEGVGDMIQPHARNRLCVVKVRKPTAMEWIENFAMLNNVHPVAIGTAMEYPHMFESFENVEDPNSNHYIYHPKSPRTAFVTPRSMEKASDILKATDSLPDDVKIHALMGVVGEAAAMDMLTIQKLDDSMPSWERVVKDPEDCPLPKNGVANCMMVAKAAMRVEKDTMDAWMIYLARLPKEVQALFAKTIMRGQKKGMAATHRKFIEWASQHSYLFS